MSPRSSRLRAALQQLGPRQRVQLARRDAGMDRRAQDLQDPITTRPAWRSPSISVLLRYAIAMPPVYPFLLAVRGALLILDRRWRPFNAEASPNLRVDHLDAVVAVDLYQLILPAIILREVNGLTEENIQAMLDLGGRVIRALAQGAAVQVADAGNTWRVCFEIPHVAMRRADDAPAEAILEHVAGDREIQRVVNVRAHLPQAPVQQFRLPLRAWKPSRMMPLASPNC